MGQAGLPGTEGSEGLRLEAPSQGPKDRALHTSLMAQPTESRRQTRKCQAAGAGAFGDRLAEPSRGEGKRPFQRSTELHFNKRLAQEMGAV